MKLFNGLGNHSVSIYRESDVYEVMGGRKMVLKPGAVPVMEIPPDYPLNAKASSRPEIVTVEGVPTVPYAGTQWESLDPLPDDDSVVIVSQQYRAAAVVLGLPTDRLATIYGTVFPDETASKPCGCLALALG